MHRWSGCCFECLHSQQQQPSNRWSAIAPATVDLYSELPNREFVIYSNDSLKQGFHDISLRATGTANPKSTGTWVAIDGMQVRYQAVDEKNDSFADLTNLYLNADASYVRDTKGQNEHVKGVRDEIKRKADEKANPILSDPETAKLVSKQVAKLLEVLTTLNSRLESQNDNIAQLELRIKALEAALRDKDLPLEKPTKPEKK